MDQSFLQEYTVGYEELEEHVNQYDPETVSQITGVPVEDIYKLARMYGKLLLLLFESEMDFSTMIMEGCMSVLFPVYRL